MPRARKRTGSGNRAGVYIRVSDESQVDTHSLVAQREEIARWCERHGYLIVEVYADEGVSARSDRVERRPQLTRLLQDAKLGKFDIVVVHTLDRWARNLGAQRLALQWLGECKIGFASVMEDFDYTSPNGRMLMNMLGSYAEFFSDQLAVHVRKAQRHRAGLGLPIGPVPFAYRTPEGGGIPLIFGPEARAVREVFQRRAQGESNGAIAKWLNDSGFKTLKGGIFTAHAVRDLLNCRFYLGIIEYNDQEYTGQHVPIISEELFQRVQERRIRRTVTRTVVGPKGLLQGMISCGHCGRGIQSDRHRYGEPMYRERHSHQCRTNDTSIMAHRVDGQMADVLTAVELKPQWREQMVQLTRSDPTGPDPKELKEKRRRLSRAYAEGAYSDTEYETKLAELDALLCLTRTLELPTLEEAAQLFADLPQLWKEATPEERRKLLSPLVERVYVDLESSMIGAIVPVPAFRRLLDGAMTKAASSAALLLSEDETERLKVWSWWRRGRVELPLTPYLSKFSSAREFVLVELLAA
ncbi:MAG: recombinase family protein [Dehalococcoidia bacterium]